MFGDDERRKRIRLLRFEERDVPADLFLEEVEKCGIKIDYAMQWCSKGAESNGCAWTVAPIVVHSFHSGHGVHALHTLQIPPLKENHETSHRDSGRSLSRSISQNGLLPAL
jgi:hypothetical protein